MLYTIRHPHSFTDARDALGAPPVVTGPVVVAASAGGTDDSCIRAAVDIAQHLDTPVEAIGAIEPIASYALGGEVMLVSSELETAHQADAEARTRARLVRAVGEWPGRCDVRYGSPARVVATAAMQRHASLLVAGAGHHGLTAQLLGAELALQAVRLGDRPVLAVQPGWRGLPRHVLCAIDFSPASVRAARLACALLADGGELRLLYVTPPAERVGLLGESWLRAQRQEAELRFAALRAMLEPLLPPGAMLEDCSRPGLVIEELLETARERDTDLIAVGTHGGGFFERLFVGSAAAGIMRHATTSVLCAPPPPAVERAWIDMRLRGTARIDEARDWAGVLDAFTYRHEGRRSWLEVDDPGTGAQLQQQGLTFTGASFDPHDRCVMLSFVDAAQPSQHLTRDVSHVDWIAVRAGARPAGEVLCLAHGRGQTLVGFAES